MIWRCWLVGGLIVACLCPWGLAARLATPKPATNTPPARAIGVVPLPENHFQTVVDRASGASAGLFVGVNQVNEDPSLAPLSCAVNDAIGLAHVFVRELKLVPAENCIICIAGEPTSGVVAKQLKLLRNDGVEVGPAIKRGFYARYALCHAYQAIGRTWSWSR